MRKSVHVTYQKQDGKWHVTNGANGTSSGAYKTQKEAMQRGRKLAMETSSEFCIHGRDGKIRQSLSYGNDPSDSMKYKKSASTRARSSSTTRRKTNSSRGR